MAQMYRDAERREGVAQRIRQLWQESGYTEAQVAERIGVSISGFQKQKSSGKISRESVEGLAKLFGSTPEWILTGRDKHDETPDLLGVKDDDPFARIENRLDGMADQLGAIEAQLALLVAALEPQKQSAAKPRKSRTSAKRRAAG